MAPSLGRAKQDDQLEPTYNSPVPIQDVAFKTCRKSGGNGSGISMLTVKDDDDDDECILGFLALMQLPVKEKESFKSKPAPLH